MPGCLLAVLTGSFHVSGCLRVLTSPHCPERVAATASAARMPAWTALPTAAVLLPSPRESWAARRNSSALARKAVASSGPEGRVRARDLANSGGS